MRLPMFSCVPQLQFFLRIAHLLLSSRYPRMWLLSPVISAIFQGRKVMLIPSAGLRTCPSSPVYQSCLLQQFWPSLKPDKELTQPAGLYKSCFRLKTSIVLSHAPDYFCVQLQKSAWKPKDLNLFVLGEGLDRAWFVTAIHCSCLTQNLSAALPQATVWHPESWEEGQLQFSVVVTAQRWPLVTSQYRPTCSEGTMLVLCLEALVICWMLGVGLT